MVGVELKNFQNYNFLNIPAFRTSCKSSLIHPNTRDREVLTVIKYHAMHIGISLLLHIPVIVKHTIVTTYAPMRSHRAAAVTVRQTRISFACRRRIWRGRTTA